MGDTNERARRETEAAANLQQEPADKQDRGEGLDPRTVDVNPDLETETNDDAVREVGASSNAPEEQHE